MLIKKKTVNAHVSEKFYCEDMSLSAWHILNGFLILNSSIGLIEMHYYVKYYLQKHVFICGIYNFKKKCRSWHNFTNIYFNPLVFFVQYKLSIAYHKGTVTNIKYTYYLQLIMCSKLRYFFLIFHLSPIGDISISLDIEVDPYGGMNMNATMEYSDQCLDFNVMFSICQQHRQLLSFDFFLFSRDTFTRNR